MPPKRTLKLRPLATRRSTRAPGTRVQRRNGNSPRTSPPPEGQTQTRAEGQTAEVKNDGGGSCSASRKGPARRRKSTQPRKWDHTRKQSSSDWTDEEDTPPTASAASAKSETTDDPGQESGRTSECSGATGYSQGAATAAAGGTTTTVTITTTPAPAYVTVQQEDGQKPHHRSRKEDFERRAKSGTEAREKDITRHGTEQVVATFSPEGPKGGDSPPNKGGNGGAGRQSGGRDPRERSQGGNEANNTPQALQGRQEAGQLPSQSVGGVRPKTSARRGGQPARATISPVRAPGGELQKEQKPDEVQLQRIDDFLEARRQEVTEQQELAKKRRDEEEERRRFQRAHLEQQQQRNFQNLRNQAMRDQARTLPISYIVQKQMSRKEWDSVRDAEVAQGTTALMSNTRNTALAMSEEEYRRRSRDGAF